VSRAVKRIAPGSAHAAPIDTLILTCDQRRTQRGAMQGSNGTAVEFEFPEPVLLRTDDRLLLDTGEVVEVVAAAEPLIEVRGDPATLARLAWALGDRHVPVQILANRIRLRREETLLPLIVSLGSRPSFIDARFDPEGGAYDGAHPHAHDHEHHHDHSHGHAHDHSGHAHPPHDGPGHGHPHDHAHAGGRRRGWRAG